MSFWQTRADSIAALDSSLIAERDLIAEIFGLIDTCILDLEKTADEPAKKATFARVAGLTALKARNFGLAAYSLALDGLAQESGAILRPFIEAVELLRYLRCQPNAVDQAINGRLPGAGDIAQKIDGAFFGLRKYLNDNASHFKFRYDSLRHMLDFSSGARFRIVQPFRAGVLRVNLGHLFCFLTFLAIEAVNCLTETGHMPVSAEALGARIDECRCRGLGVFRPHLEALAAPE